MEEGTIIWQIDYNSRNICVWLPLNMAIVWEIIICDFNWASESFLGWFSLEFNEAKIEAEEICFSMATSEDTECCCYLTQKFHLFQICDV